MTIEQKDSSFAKILYEHFASQEQNPFVVPLEHFYASGFDLSEIRNALLRFQNKSFILAPKHGWGFWEKDSKTTKTTWVMTNTEKAITDDDIEIYQIQIDTKKFPVPLGSQAATLENMVTFNKKEYRLSYRGKFTKFQKAKGRAQMFSLLWDFKGLMDENGVMKEEGTFRPIWELAVVGKFVKDEQEFEEKSATADRSVRDAIQDFRDAIKKIDAPIEILAQNGFLLVVKE